MDMTNGLTPSRRQFVAGAALACMAASWPAAARARRPFFGRHRDLELGIQLYPLSAEVERDLQGSFAKLAKLGFKAIETAGLHGHTAAELKAAADANGLAIRGMHIPVQWHRSPQDHMLTEDVAPIIADLQTVGAKSVVMALPLLAEGTVPALDDKLLPKLRSLIGAFTEADWKRTADFLNRRGEEFRKAGIRLSYHNHNFEFAPVDGTTGWDILLRETDPALVGFEMDIGWVAAAGRDPVEVLAQAKGRVQMLHMKDIDPRTKANFVAEQISVPLGKGIVDWPKLLDLAYASGVHGYFVEQEPPFANGPFAALAQSMAYLHVVR
ncbi:sugar phosphate isomerase/epimerase [Novosphingobium sp. PY1]|uniref:sugar phosphate isomerase/epimerase family protein n=1 Tax=Novosphingobium sp. PY1 TaxID=1882221 RepID=UPI001A8C5C8F|nr:sugar phosphate isomerase/epimerase [Novosphingobium sp. PY1]